MAKKVVAQPVWQTVTDRQVWETFLQANAQFEANFTQNFNWGVFYDRLNQVVYRRGYGVNGHFQAGYTAVLEQGKFYSFLTIVGGPLLDWTHRQLVRSFKNDVVQLAQQHNCVFVRFRPAVADQEAVRHALKKIQARPSPMALSVEFAGLLDLTLSDEELFANMSQSLRRKIRKAQQDTNITIEVSRDKKDAQQFAQIHFDHSVRQKYVPFSKERLVCQFETFVQDDQALLYIAKREEQILAANMIFFYGKEASYHFGVSTTLGQKYPSAPLLHLEAIAEAKRRQLKIYNFWGIVDLDQTHHRYFGVSQFKRSFGVIEHHYVPAHDLICRPALYRLIWLFETYRRKKRRL